MIRKNIFEGKSKAAKFTNIIYKYIKARDWFSNSDVMAEFMGLKSAQELPFPISKCKYNKILTKSLMDVREAIGEHNFAEKGNNRSKAFRYIGNDNDPLAEMRNAVAINNIRQYWQFCQNSAGFFPTSWLEYFFEDTHDLLEIKNKRHNGEQVLSTSIDRMYTNINILPYLYESIINHQVLSIEYKPYEEDVRTLVFHPHHLKEFNGRWHLFGHAENCLPELGYNIALDRIIAIREIEGEFYDAPSGYYIEFFNDIIGVSHLPESKVQQIHIRAHTYYVYKLTETKKLHHSQETVTPFGHYDNGEYGEFSINVKVNNELIGRILQMGAGLEIVSPLEVRTILKQKVLELAKLYE